SASVSEAIRNAAGNLTGGRTRLRQGLVVGEVALTLLLLIGAGLMLRTFEKLQTVDPGFSHERVLSFRLDLPPHQYPTVEQQIAFYRELTERLGVLPGVQHVGVAYQLPLSMEGWETTFLI